MRNNRPFSKKILFLSPPIVLLLVIYFSLKGSFVALNKLGWSQTYIVEGKNKNDFQTKIKKTVQNDNKTSKTKALVKKTKTSQINQSQNKIQDLDLSKINTQKDLLEYWQKKFSSLQGKYGWYALPLKIQTGFGINYQQSFTAASVNKVPIMLKYLLDVEDGKFSLDDTYSLSSEDIEEGTGSLQYQKVGSKYSYREVFMKTGQESDNTGVNALASLIGRKTIQPWLDSLGLKSISIKNNTASPKAMAKLFQLIFQDKIFKKSQYKQLFYKAITNTDFENRIPAGVPKDVVVAHKIGNQIQTINDCGIVFAKQPYVLCILSDGIKEDEAKVILPQISRSIYNYLQK